MVSFGHTGGKFSPSFTLEREGRVIGSYQGEIRICLGPFCECEEIHFTLYERSTWKKYDFTLDIINRELEISEKYGTTPDSLLLGEIFAKELDEKKWEQLKNEYLSYKIYMTEHTNPKKIDAVFPLEDIEENRITVGYYDILPYGQPIWIEIESINYLVDDHYCVRSHCGCTDCYLVFLPSMSSVSSRDAIPPEVLYNYETAKWDVKEDGNLHSVLRLMEKLQQKHPKLAGILKKRHTRLKGLYKQYKSKLFSEQNEPTSYKPVLANKKPGRKPALSMRQRQEIQVLLRKIGGT